MMDIVIAILVFGIAYVGLFCLSAVKKFNLKITSTILFLLLIVTTAIICVNNPVMHKPFSINVIEYLVKINDDGSMSTTKQTTQTVLKKQPRQPDSEVR